MRSWSVARKVTLVFALLLTLTALMIGFTAWQAWSVKEGFGRAGDVHRLLSQLRTLQAISPGEVAMTPSPSGNYVAVFADLARSVEAIEGFVGEVSPRLTAELARFRERLDHYEAAFTETLKAYRADRDYARHRLFARTLEADAPSNDALLRDRIEIGLAEFYLSRNLERLDAIRTDLSRLSSAELRERISERIEAAEANYVAYLGILEREAFLHSSLNWLIDLGEGVLSDLDRRSREVYPRFLGTQLGWLAIYALTVFLIGVAAVRYVRRFLAAQTHAMAAIEAGRYDYRPSPLPDDELGELGRFMKRLALGLQESHSLLESSLENLPVMVAILDGREQVQLVNHAFLRTLGAERAQVCGKALLDGPFGLRLLDARQDVRLALMDAQSGAAQRFEIRLAAADGTERLLEVALQPIEIGAAAEPQLILVAADLTERIRVREALERRDALLRKLSSRIPGVIYQFQLFPDGRSCFPYASDGIEQIYGIKASDVQESAQPVFDMLHPADRDRVAERIWKSAQTMTLWQDRYRVLIPGRPLGWRDGQAVPERMADGSVLWHGYIWDSTEWVYADEGLRLAGRVFESASEGLLITDRRGRVVRQNVTFCELTGWSPQQMARRGLRRLHCNRHPKAFYRGVATTLASSGHWKGEAWIARRQQEPVPTLAAISEVKDDDGTVTHYVLLFDDISRLKEQQRRLEHLAHHDALTQLPNRVLFADRLEQAMARVRRGGGLLLVAYMDLDEFKAVNDSRGHKAGDRLLVEVAKRLTSLVREGDTVARLGGDEFALVLNDLADVAACRQCMARLLEGIARPYLLTGASLSYVSASIGGALFRNEPVSGDELVRQADQAMYRAKELGRNRFEFFEQGRVRGGSDRENSLTRIERALREREFVLHYQPKVDMRAARVVGAEALIRWAHPQRGLVAPGDFLPVIEGTEFVVPLGDWVLDTALDQLDRWRSAGFNLCLSVNISPGHLQNPGFAERLAEHLSRHPKVTPGCLELEILESTALEDIGYVSDVIGDCRAQGVRFALDDFGTGFSSLAYLKGVPADVLKIDQSFVRDMLVDRDDLAIVEAVISLGRTFRKQVVAEGVETADHGLVLLRAGCVLVQGYGIARPMPAEALESWIGAFVPDPRWKDEVVEQARSSGLPLLVADLQHQRWLQEAEDFLMSDRLSPDFALRPNDCAFGLWFHADAQLADGSDPGIRDLQAAHRLVHDLVSDAVALKQAGETEQARQMLPRIQDARALLLATLEANRKPPDGSGRDLRH